MVAVEKDFSQFRPDFSILSHSSSVSIQSDMADTDLPGADQRASMIQKKMESNVTCTNTMTWILLSKHVS